MESKCIESDWQYWKRRRSAMKEFEGKVALVTGGGSGIGRATALAFGREGAQVVIGNRNVERGEETASIIREAGGTASFKRTDVLVAAEIEADRKSTRLNSSHLGISYAVFCLKKKKKK